ncbi:hypothetical protein FN846DRAFT_889905 [Sphaerosporella brunnea]|uniref:non-specific serine/threonine protein kinase n=1 Tax=Sphaerosporella brunnea TaxID=1250544 RepID=A0A5J5EXS3_9PEZI|nr:hypothetical protein FN846DRAFT_889905 [Sphaerosporella brunnea]
MPPEHGSRKQFGKQKTYGKQVKSHLNGWFARNLWAELDNESVPKTKTPNDVKTREEDIRTKDDTSSSSDDEDEVTDRIVTQEIVTPESAGEADNILSKLDDLAIVEEEPTAAPVLVERRASIVVAQELHPQSSVSSLRESSDKENETIFTTAPTTPHKAYDSENVPLFDDTPRSVLGERNSPSITESPPRKRGLRKKLSASTAGAPSPLKNESFVVREREASLGSVDAIKVWEDDEQDTIVVRASLAESATDARSIRSRTKEPVDGQPQDPTPATPKAEQQHQTVIEGSVVEEIRTEQPKPSAENTETEVEDATAPVPGASEEPSELPGVDGDVEASEAEEISELDKLLGLCTDQKILDFTKCIDIMLKNSSIRKLGEASYSEVFLQSHSDSNSTTVLKIIPFSNEEQCEVKQIIQEVRITKAMAEIEGFIGFRGAYVVRGYFPATLVELWDAFDEERGSENMRPSLYSENQLFSIIMLENGGKDLEHTELYSWEEAADVFWQVATALSRGEEQREFEHRDLHWGNIVIRRIGQDQSPEALLQSLSLEDTERASKLKVALIDYTLSRAYCGDLSGGGDIEFIPLEDPALFTGKGDYQFDIYRFMRKHLSSGLVPPDEEYIDWNVFAPRTNIFWLHYLVNILLTKMGIPRPAARGRNAASPIEMECFKCLETVGRTIDPRKKSFGKTSPLQSAQELVAWAEGNGWL